MTADGCAGGVANNVSPAGNHSLFYCPGRHFDFLNRSLIFWQHDGFVDMTFGKKNSIFVYPVDFRLSLLIFLRSDQ
jgi:hypothetical protein